MATGNMPATARTLPSSPSSPTSRNGPKSSIAQRSVSTQDADRDGQVEAGALLLQIGGREIDGDEGGRNQVAGVFDGRAHPVAAFADGRVRKADGVEVVLIADYAAQIDFDVDQTGVDAVDGGAEGLEEHGWRIEASVTEAGNSGQ